MAEEVVEQSEVLDTEEVANIVEGTEPDEAVELPSEQQEFKMPDKFEGKSAEDIAKAYVELEKFKAKQAEEKEVVQESQEEKPKGEETSDTTEFNKYVESFEKNGELSEEDYAELEKAGYNKEVVDKEIDNYKQIKEFNEYKAEKQLNELIEPLGGGKDKFKEVAVWANESKTPEEVKAFNEALASVSKVAQQAMLKGLYSEYDAAGKEEGQVLHTNSGISRPTEGYKTQEAFFKDRDSEEYENNPKFRAAVEAKMAKSGDLF